MAEELAKPGRLGVPVTVSFKNGGSNHEPVVYVYGKPADGYTIKHTNGSFAGYYNLPHFTHGPDDFDLIVKVEKTLYGVAIRCDNSEGIKSWKDLVAYAKEHPGELAMGSNKVGSLHHQHQTALMKAADLNIRFVPYKGTGGVVKDVVGGHLKLGFAQPSLWDQHIESGTICPLLMLNDERLTVDPQWKDVPDVREVDLDYDIPYQWQGFEVKKGTPPEIEDKIAAAAKAVTESDAYKAYLKHHPEVVPAFESDRAKLKKDFAKEVKTSREFMIENHLLKDDKS
jgi:tripartite-type tricarboxylate transporter receptor subunit TctC